jgi:anti-sigma B factor antagonist
MNTELSIETVLLGGNILGIVLNGNLNATTSEQFNKAIQNHLDQGQTKIIIDCRRVEYITSVGLGSLVALQARLRKKGGEVKLAGLYGLAADAIRLVGLDKLLNIYSDMEYARESFCPPTLRPKHSTNSP